MIAPALLAAATAALALPGATLPLPKSAPGRAASNPAYQQDPMGPLVNVTRNWRHYQPASAFCIKPTVNEYAQGGDGATATGADPVCRRSGFSRKATGLVKIRISTPTLCGVCRRVFFDFSKIPAHNAPPLAYAHGHAYYHLYSFNPSYTVDSHDHSPNTKDFSNDKLIVPEGSPQQPVVSAFDLHAIAYVTDTANFVHTASQGPYYIGPWYFNRQWQKIRGVYLDVNVGNAPPAPGGAQGNAIGYYAGFNSGQACPSDDDAYYGGCSDWGGSSAEMIDPFASR